jgi:SAM-dependent methyltransferase
VTTQPSPWPSASPSPSSVYDTIGQGYIAHRQADPRWEALINEQLGDGRVVVNVGAGTGNYEPVHRAVVAVEPSGVMVEQRAPGAAPAVRASGSALPLPSDCADVVMAILTVHHWDDWEASLAELRRVAPRRVVLTMDFELHSRFWLLQDFVPEVGEYTRRLGPGHHAVAAALGGGSSIPLLMPRDMEDGVLGAYWCRPEAYLEPAVRANCSGLALAELPAIDLGYRLVVADES